MRKFLVDFCMNPPGLLLPRRPAQRPSRYQKWGFTGRWEPPSCRVENPRILGGPGIPEGRDGGIRWGHTRSRCPTLTAQREAERGPSREAGAGGTVGSRAVLDSPSWDRLCSTCQCPGSAPPATGHPRDAGDNSLAGPWRTLSLGGGAVGQVPEEHSFTQVGARGLLPGCLPLGPL